MNSEFNACHCQCCDMDGVVTMSVHKNGGRRANTASTNEKKYASKPYFISAFKRSPPYRLWHCLLSCDSRWNNTPENDYIAISRSLKRHTIMPMCSQPAPCVCVYRVCGCHRKKCLMRFGRNVSVALRFALTAHSHARTHTTHKTSHFIYLT